ncbi:hypothetical protein [Yersinia intermedia]|uniref:hypothetical protein n=1 Tax=Yersinia intermedia TaxID=631 RepID=UPI00065CCB3C|nr:hypothetical protein [Yersinia intermedia]CRY84085.1 Uncharacterised protein [Yersinia intermedia]
MQARRNMTNLQPGKGRSSIAPGWMKRASLSLILILLGCDSNVHSISLPENAFIQPGTKIQDKAGISSVSGIDQCPSTQLANCIHMTPETKIVIAYVVPEVGNIGTREGWVVSHSTQKEGKYEYDKYELYRPNGSSVIFVEPNSSNTSS